MSVPQSAGCKYWKLRNTRNELRVMGRARGQFNLQSGIRARKKCRIATILSMAQDPPSLQPRSPNCLHSFSSSCFDQSNFANIRSARRDRARDRGRQAGRHVQADSFLPFTLPPVGRTEQTVTRRKRRASYWIFFLWPLSYCRQLATGRTDREGSRKGFCVER